MRFPNLGFTDCHQIHLDEDGLRKKWSFTFDSYAKRLEESNIIVDAVGRLGTNEVTRLGGTKDTMRVIADMMIRSLNGRNVAKEAADLRSSLSLGYC